MKRQGVNKQALARDPLDTPIQYVKGVGPQRARDFQAVGLETVGDLLRYFPKRHEDRSKFLPLRNVVHGQRVTVRGVVADISETKPRPGLTLTKVLITDGTGIASIVWFNQPYMKREFKRGITIIVSGKVNRRFGEVQLTDVEHEIYDSSDLLHTGRIVPVYPLSGRLQQRSLRRVIRAALDAYSGFLEEVVPIKVKKKLNLLDVKAAYENFHFPKDVQAFEAARRTLAFEELFVVQVGLAISNKGFKRSSKPLVHLPDGELVSCFLSGLPFELTSAQKRVMREIGKDMESTEPMSRLLQGDVGSGKTVMAAYALVKAVENGYQAALMAPTEILAEQHYNTITGLLRPLRVKVWLLTGGTPQRERENIMQSIAAGEPSITIGTHALIQEDVRFNKLSLVVTDEQHRFGVRQRSLLQRKGESPDVLVMTATPIPRTLALTLYGDLDLSVLDELPPGRRPVETYWLHESERSKAYRFMRKEVMKGRQCYVVCPLIEESESLQAQAATELASKLEREVFPDLRIGLVHGRQSKAEKDLVMEKFRSGEIDVLVATTIIEVGVDVPNASVILIEGADRFGLSQLHQLRGRVGRSAHPSYCFLIANPSTDDARERLRAIAGTSDGFMIADEDLRIRGPGEFFGTRQHGMPDFRVADPLKDIPLLEAARSEAFQLVQENPELKGSEFDALRRRLSAIFKDRLSMITVG